MFIQGSLGWQAQAVSVLGLCLKVTETIRCFSMIFLCTGYFRIRCVLYTWQNRVLLTASVTNTVWLLKNNELLFFFLLQSEESFTEKHLLRSLH